MIDFVLSKDSDNHKIFYSLDPEVKEMIVDEILGNILSLPLEVSQGSMITWKHNAYGIKQGPYAGYYKFCTHLGLNIKLCCLYNYDIASDEYFCNALYSGFTQACYAEKEWVLVTVFDRFVSDIYSGYFRTDGDNNEEFQKMIHAVKEHYLR
jgi:hypothetical protein